MPKVSVVMTVRNGERFIREAVDSILSQTFPDFELIIVDDESTDSTGAILAQYQAQDSRVIVDSQPTRRGVAVCRNLGSQRAAGEYLAVMDADDVSLPNRLEKQAAFLDRSPDIGMAGSFVDYIDEYGHLKGAHRAPVKPDVLRWQLFFTNPFTHSSMMMRRAVVLSLGGYREGIGAAEDFELIARASLQFKLGIVPDVLLQYRQLGGSLTSRTMQALEIELLAGMRLMIEHFLHESVSPLAVNALRLADWHQPMENLAQIRAGASLLERLYATYTRTIELSADEANAIAEDAALRWYTLARRSFRLSPTYALSLGLKGALRSPRSVRKIVSYYAR